MRVLCKQLLAHHAVAFPSETRMGGGVEGEGEAECLWPGSREIRLERAGEKASSLVRAREVGPIWVGVEEASSPARKYRAN